MAIVRAKYKLDRRTGLNILGRPKSAVHTRNYPPGQHGNPEGKSSKSRRSKISEFGIKVLERKKVRHFYGGLRFKDLKRIMKESIERPGSSVDNAISLLESRLSSVVYRAKMAITPFGARQLVNHGHIKVNGKKIDINSYRLKIGDKVELSADFKENSHYKEACSTPERQVPSWLVVDGMTCTVNKLPVAEDVVYPADMNFRLLVEFFSR